jgi:hypothetical protein
VHTNVIQAITQLHSIKAFLLFLWQEIWNLHKSFKFLSKMLGQTSKTRVIYIQVDPMACVVGRPKLWMGSWGSYGAQRGWWVLLDLQNKLWLTLIHNKLLEWRSVPHYYVHTTHKCAWETFTLPLDWMDLIRVLLSVLSCTPKYVHNLIVYHWEWTSKEVEFKPVLLRIGCEETTSEKRPQNGLLLLPKDLMM